jgi:glutamate racemase
MTTLKEGSARGLHRRLPIGVFDSGIGGLTVVRSLQKRLPNERLIYLGDTARVPYGTKSASTVIRYATQIADFLIKQQIKYLIVACNTASAHALDHLRQHLDVPVLGVVVPGAQTAAALSRSGKVGVLGTLGTVSSGAYQRAMHTVRADLVVFSQACPLLVPLADEGWLTHPVTHQIARHYLIELATVAGDIDTLVLGCTHYPLLRDVIAQQAEEVFTHPVDLVDSGEACANAVCGDLINRELDSDQRMASDQFFFTDVNRFSEIAERFLGRPVTRAEPVDLL